MDRRDLYAIRFFIVIFVVVIGVISISALFLPLVGVIMWTLIAIISWMDQLTHNQYKPPLWTTILLSFIATGLIVGACVPTPASLAFWVNVVMSVVLFAGTIFGSWVAWKDVPSVSAER